MKFKLPTISTKTLSQFKNTKVIIVPMWPDKGYTQIYFHYGGDQPIQIAQRRKAIKGHRQKSKYREEKT